MGASSEQKKFDLPPLGKVAWVAAGGAIGGTARHLLIVAFPIARGSFPWVVFVENVVGAFALGLLLTILMRRKPRRWDARPFLATGVLGSFTTFSSLSLDIVDLAGASSLALVLVHALGSLVVGLAAAVLGIASGRALVGEAS